VEDPAVYEKVFKPFTDHLAQCTAKRVVFFQVQSNAAEIEAMRSGRLHVGGFSTGPTAFAVNIAGAVPFAVKGYEKEFQGYNLIVIVRKESAFQKLADLKGRKVAHTSPSSNSGHMAPMALFPREGLNPGKDYNILFSGKHDQSVLGYRSAKFPTSSFAYAHDLEPTLRDRMLKCFYDYRFTDDMKKAFDGADRFFPVTYQKEWAVVREVAEAGGEKFNGAAYEREARREEEARRKAAEAKAKAQGK
jgi:phosphonate transport system substrate-binding protein